MSGQSVLDRVVAAKHTITGSDIDKSVCKATTEEIMGPKKKHLDYLMHCSNAPQINIPELADKLTNRTLSPNWVVVFKSLVTCHHLMIYGNEKLIQYIATRNMDLNLPNFLDKTGVQGYEMSTYIRRYAKYVNQKAVSYRLVAFDFCRVKRGKEDGLLRSMQTEKLLKTLPILQEQLDSLLEFEVNSSQLSNGVITSCFMLLFKDCIRLFACYNDGIINLLEKFFEMCKKDCKTALDLYQKFLIRMDKVSDFLTVAEQVGIDKGEIPDLAKALDLQSSSQWLNDLVKAPSSLLDALKQHVQSLESSKKVQWVKPATIASAVNAFSSNLANIDPDEKKLALEEEKSRLAALKKHTHMPQSAVDVNQSSTNNNPFNASTSPTVAAPAPATTPSQDLFSVVQTNPSQPQQTTSKPSEDLMGLAPNPMAAVQATLQAQSQMMHPGVPGSSPWGSPNGVMNSQVSANFEQAFGSTPAPAGQELLGEIMQPMNKPEEKAPTTDGLISNGTSKDIDSTLAQLATNLDMKVGTPKNLFDLDLTCAGKLKADHQWTKNPSRNVKTGGANWTPQQTTSTTWPQGQPYMEDGIQTQPPKPGGQPADWRGGAFSGQFVAPAQPMSARPAVPGMGYNAPMAQPMYRPPSQQPTDPFGSL
ncbi:phosphatidylinositol-binding clathrin assembly protein LAP-like isoform X3 [Anneissia japonica]|uniref:phosphatidylinositol-binding clathrin assembly protein LAP-like isoform X3 n=1 Tax=Anneissia japonica TaxID=1529436 RepID=UPI001425819B|nr:phosphatidylinositol-binding clathrin assembly protein LAP-like isoform X3 [Anneissia japonica]